MQHVSQRTQLIWLLAAIVVPASSIIGAPRAGAHKGMVSPYNYNEHVYPILHNRCGGCHFDDGPTPMSLLDYDSAMQWAEPIREQLISESMPPSDLDPLGPAIRGANHLT